MVGVSPVAKKKPGPKPELGGPETWKKKPLILNLRGSEEFKAWLQDLAAADRQSVSGVVERALVHYAKGIGFTKEAPER